MAGLARRGSLLLKAQATSAEKSSGRHATTSRRCRCRHLSSDWSSAATGRLKTACTGSWTWCSQRREARAQRPRAGQVHHHEAHGPQPAAKAVQQTILAWQTQGGRLGRWLPRKPNHGVKASPDSSAIVGWLYTLCYRPLAIEPDRPQLLMRANKIMQGENTWQTPLKMTTPSFW